MKVIIGLIILALMVHSCLTDEKEKTRRAVKARRKKQAKLAEKRKQEALNRALEIMVALDDD